MTAFHLSKLWYFLGLFSLLAGIILFSLALGNLYQNYRRRQRLSQRLRGNQKEELIQARVFKANPPEQNSLIVPFVEKITGLRLTERLQRHLLQADIYWSSNNFLCLLGLIVLVGMLPGLWWNSLLWSGGLALVLGILPILFIRWRKQRKSALFEKQMPEAMELVARSLRAGHTLPSALELVGREMSPPLGTEMRLAFEEQRYGLSMSEALRRMVYRVESPDLRYWVTAVLIQTETGGNLAEIMEKIGQVIRERLKLRSKIKALSAEGRISALILGLLPIGVFLMLYLINRDYVMTLFREPIGRKLLMCGVGSVLLGVLWMKKMLRIEC